MNKYGQNHDEVARYIEQIKNLTPEQIEQVKTADAAYAAAYAYAATDAAYAAYAAAAYAAYDADAYAATYAAYDADADAYDAAARKFRWYLRRGAFALAIKHLIGTKGFTQAHYDLLTAPVRLLESFQVVETPKPRIIIYREKLQAALDHRSSQHNSNTMCHICYPMATLEDMITLVDAVMERNTLK